MSIIVKEKTVFILGAGASVTFGRSEPNNYPSGLKLLERIKYRAFKFSREVNEHNDNDFRECDMWAQLGYGKEEFEEFYTALMTSAVYSIDKFLEYRHEFAELGKLLIAIEIKECEDIISLFNVHTDNWYAELFDRLDANIDNILENKISFVTFNYDRTLEVFLFCFLKQKIKNAKNEDERIEKVIKVLDKINIFHMYGELACYPWNENGFHYDYNNNLEAFPKMAKNIKVMGEERHESDFDTPKKWISEAKKVYFMGFGYDELNLARLGINYKSKNFNISFAGTGYSLKKRIINKFDFVPSFDLEGSYGIAIDKDNRTCSEFLEECVRLK